jgi:hypothetical protein
VAEFIKCPFCSGHEAVSPEAAERIAGMIYNSMDGWPEDSPLATELWNIRNAILNTQEREQPREEYTPPLCPTPDKAKYGDAKHAAPNAAKYRQHPYQCECGYWHLSKQAPAAHLAKINSLAAGADEFEAIDPLLT